MSNIKKAIVISIVILLLVPFSACQSKKEPDNTAVNNLSVSATEPEQPSFALLPAINYNGEEFVIGNIEQDGYNWIDVTLDVEVEDTSELLKDAIYNRNLAVEDKYNVTLKFIDVPYGEMANKVRNQMMAGYCEYDIMQMPMKYTIMPLTTENYIADANKLDKLDLTNPWWDDFAHESTSICGKQFFLFGDFTIADMEYATVIFLNREMQKTYNLPDFYQIVRDGDWTCDKMLEPMKVVTDDLDGDGKWTKNDQYGLVANIHSMQQVFYGAGQTIVKKDSDDMPYFSVNNESYINAFFKMCEFMNTDNTTADGMGLGSHQDEMFANGKALFDATLLAAVRAPMGYQRGMDYEFGILPPPKLDDKQEHYYSYQDYSTPCMAILNNDDERLERSSVLLEALNAKSSEVVQPKYMEYALPYKYFRDEESFEMLEITLKNRIFDIAGIYGWGGFEDKMRGLLSSNKPGQVASFIETNLTMSEEAMLKDIEKILNLK